jgi:glycine/D-amino acid oxidase-like deaminating enzyme
MRRAMNETVNEVGRVAAAEGVDCHWAKGGTVWLARSRVQLQRAEATVAGDATFDGVDGFTLLTADDARARANATGVLGGVYTEHCARIQPARLVRGLARLVEARGGTVYEGTRVTAIRPRAGNHDAQVETERGTVRAHQVVRATEAWTSTLPGNRRDVVPVYSLMIATEPLPASFWDEAGLSKGETFSDERHLIVYGQRTADDRLVFGGRGAPYHWGSGIRAEYDREPAVFSALKRTVTELFPGLGSVRFTHAWGGPLGIPRDWHASVGLDPATGIGWAGGYVGDGVGTTNLSGRTLADLISGEDTELTRLPWVGHRSPQWEPEPLRWLGVNAGLQAMTAADSEERLTGRSSLTARLMAPMIGH